MAQLKGTEDKFALDNAAQGVVNAASELAWNWLPALPWVGWLFRIPPMSWVLNAYRKYHTAAAAKRAGNEVAGAIIDVEKERQQTKYDAAVDEGRELNAKPEITEEERQAHLEKVGDALGDLVSRRKF